MDYEKKIKNALNDKSVPFEVQAWLEEQFPELKESKDNRIMNIIRGWIYTRPASFFDNGISKEEILAWLEKQGEQKPANSYCQENCKGFQETGKCFADGDCKAKREAESTNKVEPKFKVGDWIVFNGLTLYIKEVVKGYYRTISFDGINNSYDWDIDNIARLWTIQDAKNGDVLVNGSNIFIFHFINGTRLMGYCHVNTDNGRFYDDIGKNECFCLIDAVINPATKEQRDLLFQKMKEAEYIFDFKNKELKKIKNDIEIPFGAKDSELQEATYYIPKGFHAEIDYDKVVIKKGEKPAAWSKKDEKMFEYALNMIEWYSGKNEDKSRYVSDWLKSLKQRIGG